jgi:hypothetical protein
VKDEEKDAKALSQLIMGVCDHHLSTVMACKTAKEAWETLESIFRSKSIAKRVQLKKQLVTLHLENDSITKYINRAKGIRDQLIAAGMQISEEDVVIHVLSGLPKEYEAVVTFLEGSDELKLDTVMARLLQVEGRVDRRDHDDRALMAHAKGVSNLMVCWHCKQPGHKKNKCPLLQARLQAPDGKAAVAVTAGFFNGQANRSVAL